MIDEWNPTGVSRSAESDRVPFNQFGGLGKAYELFGDTLTALLEELNARLAA